MCRWVVYVSPRKPILLAELLTRPPHSIVHQSFACTERTVEEWVPKELNADGFGVVWFPDEDTKAKEKDARVRSTPCMFKSVLPAWNNLNLWRIAEKVTSPLIFGHVRAASFGSPVTEANCHPFVLSKFCFMHNGGVGNWAKVKGHVMRLIRDDLLAKLYGSSDSEHVFLLFLSQLPTACLLRYNKEDPNLLLTALRKTLQILVKLQVLYGGECASALNFALTDGYTTLVSRVVVSTRKPTQKLAGASLYFSVGSGFRKCSDGIYRMRHTDRIEDVVIVASERLTPVVEDWVPVTTNSILLISDRTNVLMMPFDVPSAIDNVRKQSAKALSKKSTLELDDSAMHTSASVP